MNIENEMNSNRKYLQKVLENTRVYWFDYDVRNRTAINSEKFCNAVGCDKTYDNMPDSFAEKMVFPADRENFCALFEKIHSGEESASAEITEISGGHSFNITLTSVERGDDGSVLSAIGIVEPLSTKKKSENELLEISHNLMRENYYRIACISLHSNSMQTVSIADAEKDEAKSFYEDYRSAIADFTNRYVLKQYREKFSGVMQPDKMKKLFDSGLKHVSVTYQRYESGVPHWVRTELIPMPDYAEGNERVMWYVKNIPEEKALEKKLSDKYLKINTDMNIQMKTILNGISGGFKISHDDEEYTYTFVGESAAGLFGYSVEEFLQWTGGKAVNTIYPPDLDEVMRQVDESLSSGDSYSVKYRVMCSDGSIRWIVDSGMRIVNEDGEAFIYSLYHDVTELEQRNIELQDTLLMLDLIVNSLSCGILVYRLPNRRIITFNKEAKRIFDCDEIASNDDFDMDELLRNGTIPEHSGYFSRIASNIRKPGDRYVYEFRICHRNGKILKIQTNSIMVEFADKSRCILSTMQDITEQSRLSAVLKDERKQYRDALLSNCLYAFSVDLTIDQIIPDDIVQPKYRSLGFVDIKSFTSFSELIYCWHKEQNPKFTVESMEKVISRSSLLSGFANGRASAEVEYYHEALDKTIRITCLLSERSRDSHIMAFIIGTDITESRRKETQTKQALAEAYKAAAHANSAKSDFLSRISHDIRIPMNSIIDMAAAAGANIDEKEKVADCLNKINTSSQQMLSLINEILDMSKIESAKSDLNEHAFDLSDMIDNFILMMRPRADEKRQCLNVHFDSVAHEKLIGDELRIRQIFVNLVSNSIQYTPPGGNIDIYIYEKKTANPRVGSFRFVFEDNGIGMDEEFIGHIFEPFAKANDSRVSPVQGAGLGMTITNNLVSMMNGDIIVESKPGEGTRFIVSMTLRIQDDTEPE